MKIKELITESQVTDEGVLSALGTGIGAVGKGIGAISGAYQGAKDQFNKGHASARAHVGGHMPAQPKDTSARDAEFQKLTGKSAPGAQQAPAQGAAPAGGQQQGAANPQDLATQIKAKQKELTDLKAQQKQAQKQAPKDLAPPPQTQPGIGQASNGNNSAATATEPSQTGATAPTNTASAPQPAPGERVEPTMDPAATQGADNTVAQQPGAGQPNLQVQQGGKAPAPAGRTQGGGRVAGQLSNTPGAVRKRNARQVKSDQERMATGTNESVDFYSNFLGQKL